MGNEAVYRERFENVLRVVDQVVDGAGQLFGRHLDLCRWDTGPGGGACIMGLCSLDEWFQAQGFRTCSSTMAYGGGAPEFCGHRGGAAVARFLNIDANIFEALFCTSGYSTRSCRFSAECVSNRIAEYIGYRFEARTCSPELMAWIHKSGIAEQQGMSPFLMSNQASPSNMWPAYDFAPGPTDTVTFTTTAPSMSYYVGSQLMTVPAMPTSPPFTRNEVAEIMKQMAMQSALLTGIAPPNIKPPVSMSEVINAMLANA